MFNYNSMLAVLLEIQRYHTKEVMIMSAFTTLSAALKMVTALYHTGVINCETYQKILATYA